MSALRGGRGCLAGGGREVIKGLLEVRLLEAGFIIVYRDSSTSCILAGVARGGALRYTPTPQHYNK